MNELECQIGWSMQKLALMDGSGAGRGIPAHIGAPPRIGEKSLSPMGMGIEINPSAWMGMGIKINP